MTAPKRRAQPQGRRKAPKPPRKTGGGRVSGAVNVAPKFTLFGGGLFTINIGGGGRKGGRGRGGLFGRLQKLAASAGTAFGKSSRGGAPSPGMRASGASSWDSLHVDVPELDEGLDTDVYDPRQVEDFHDGMPETDLERGYRLRPMSGGIGHEIDPGWAPDGDDGTRRDEAIRRSRGML